MATLVELGRVPDSDEEGAGRGPRDGGGPAHPAAHSDWEEVLSDGEPAEAAWLPAPHWAEQPPAVLRQLNAGGGQQQERAKPFSRCRPAGLASMARASSSGRTARYLRPMKTAAAAEADSTAAQQAAVQAAELAAALQESGADGCTKAAAKEPCLQPPAQQQQPTAAAAPGLPGGGGGSFLNRKVLPRAPQQGNRCAAQTAAAEAPAARETNPAAAQPAAQPAATPTGPAPQQEWRLGAPQAAPLARPAAAAVPAATYHRTTDGLNVVYLNRQPAAAPASGDSAAAKGGRGRGRADAVNSGWGNNFVRIDMKKGRGSTKYANKHGSKKRKRAGGRGGSRWQTPRMRQVGDGSDFLEGWQASRMRCYKCGGSGHFARDCTAEQQAQADTAALCSGSSDEEGAGDVAAPPGSAPQQQAGRRPGGPQAVDSGAAGGSQRTASAGAVPAAASDPCEQYAAVLADPSETALTAVLSGVFGHSAFRGLQLATLQRLLAGESLLSIMPTGMGKSLCYQLPALLLPGLTLVVSPLIALMHDQAASVPPPLTVAVLWSGQRREEAMQVLADVAAGRIKVLFVSPERLNNPNLLKALAPRMPLPLVVVDEAHCVAEWGHSFRPAYFRLGAALASGVQAQRILALTATATRATEAAIRQVLRIPAESVLRDAAVRQNLRLRVLRTSGGSSSQGTRTRICGLFSGSGALAAVPSAIVYCPFKEDANQLARLLGAHGVSARAYHAGKDYRERSAVEADFAAGRVRVVVATVAFGMGIDLARVGAVVHAALPRSLEEYVQQVGRSGRDGSEARCVALLDDGDFVRLRSLAFSGVLDLAAVRAFLAAVFSPAAEGHQVRRGSGAKAGGKAAKGGGGRGPKAGRKRKLEEADEADGSSQEEEGVEEEEAAAPPAPLQPDAEAGLQRGAMERGAAGGGQPGAGPRRFGVLAVKKMGAELDMRDDSMESVLSYLEADARPCLRMLPATALSVKVSFYAAAPEQLAVQHPIVQSVLEACALPRNGVYSVPAARLAAVAQKAPGLVLQDLRDMAAGSLIGFELSREEGPSYEILYTPPDLDSLARQVHARLAAVLACQVSRLDVSYRALNAAVRAGQAGAGTEAAQQAAAEAALRMAVDGYFEEAMGVAAARSSGCDSGSQQDGSMASGCPADSTASPLLLDTQGLPLKRAEPALLQAARAVLRRNREQAGAALSARALARILHGVGSPGFPSDAWHKRMGAFWGSQTHVDFAAVLKAAEIVTRDDD